MPAAEAPQRRDADRGALSRQARLELLQGLIRGLGQRRPDPVGMRLRGGATADPRPAAWLVHLRRRAAGQPSGSRSTRSRRSGPLPDGTRGRHRPLTERGTEGRSATIAAWMQASGVAQTRITNCVPKLLPRVNQGGKRSSRMIHAK